MAVKDFMTKRVVYVSPETTVATAAPTTSNLGNGPTPRTRSGSRIIFSIRPKKFAFNGVLESPWAVKRPVSTWEKKENRISPQVIFVY